MATAVSIIIAAVLLIFLVDRHMSNRKLSEELDRQKETNLELLKRIPVVNDGTNGLEPLSVEKIADAVRMEGFFPETEGNLVRFKVQGESYCVDAGRLPLLFIVDSYNVNPEDWEMDILRDAAHRMSDDIVMVKTTIADDNKSLSFFIAAADRNYESFRTNLTTYLSILEDGRRKMNEEYHRMVDEKREAALRANPILPPLHPDTKVVS